MIFHKAVEARDAPGAALAASNLAVFVERADAQNDGSLSTWAQVFNKAMAEFSMSLHEHGNNVQLILQSLLGTFAPSCQQIGSNTAAGATTGTPAKDARALVDSACEKVLQWLDWLARLHQVNLPSCSLEGNTTWTNVTLDLARQARSRTQSTIDASLQIVANACKGIGLLQSADTAVGVVGLVYTANSLHFLLSRGPVQRNSDSNQASNAAKSAENVLRNTLECAISTVHRSLDAFDKAHVSAVPEREYELGASALTLLHHVVPALSAFGEIMTSSFEVELDSAFRAFERFKQHVTAFQENHLVSATSLLTSLQNRHDDVVEEAAAVIASVDIDSMNPDTFADFLIEQHNELRRVAELVRDNDVDGVDVVDAFVDGGAAGLRDFFLEFQTELRPSVVATLLSVLDSNSQTAAADQRSESQPRVEGLDNQDKPTEQSQAKMCAADASRCHTHARLLRRMLFTSEFTTQREAFVRALQRFEDELGAVCDGALLLLTAWQQDGFEPGSKYELGVAKQVDAILILDSVVAAAAGSGSGAVESICTGTAGAGVVGSSPLMEIGGRLAHLLGVATRKTSSAIRWKLDQSFTMLREAICLDPALPVQQLLEWQSNVDSAVDSALHLLRELHKGPSAAAQRCVQAFDIPCDAAPSRRHKLWRHLVCLYVEGPAATLARAVSQPGSREKEGDEFGSFAHRLLSAIEEKIDRCTHDLRALRWLFQCTASIVKLDVLSKVKFSGVHRSCSDKLSKLESDVTKNVLIASRCEDYRKLHALVTANPGCGSNVAILDGVETDLAVALRSGEDALNAFVVQPMALSNAAGFFQTIAKLAEADAVVPDVVFRSPTTVHSHLQRFIRRSRDVVADRVELLKERCKIDLTNCNFRSFELSKSCLLDWKELLQEDLSKKVVAAEEELHAARDERVSQLSATFDVPITIQLLQLASSPAKILTWLNKCDDIPCYAKAARRCEGHFRQRFLETVTCIGAGAAQGNGAAKSNPASTVDNERFLDYLQSHVDDLLPLSFRQCVGDAVTKCKAQIKAAISNASKVVETKAGGSLQAVSEDAVTFKER